MKRCRSHLVWEAWTDFGSVGAGRKSVLRKSDKISQGLGHPRLDPTGDAVSGERRAPKVVWKPGEANQVINLNLRSASRKLISGQHV